MSVKSLNNSSASAILPPRAPSSHKGTFGRILLICGSRNMVGCCSLAAMGALRSGAGLVTVAFPDELYNSLTASVKECLFLPLETDDRGFISHLSIPLLLEEAEKSDVVMVGCGMGVGYAQSLIVTSLLRMENKPLIIDADGLNCLAMCPEIIKKAKANVLLTPHPGEMSRLSSSAVSLIEENRTDFLESFVKKFKVNVLLKGHETLIAKSDGSEMYINNTGNSGLAKGGSGDLLSGIIAGLTPSLGGDVFMAGVLGAYVHGMSADILKDDISEYSILPTDCVNALGRVYKIIETSGIN